MTAALTRSFVCGTTSASRGSEAIMHALLFDLDGTLVDTVYAHVIAWQAALGEAGVAVDGYRLHRHVGSSGRLIVRFAQREAGRQLSAEQEETIHRRHSELFRELVPRPRPLPGGFGLRAPLCRGFAWR